MRKKHWAVSSMPQQISAVDVWTVLYKQANIRHVLGHPVLVLLSVQGSRTWRSRAVQTIVLCVTRLVVLVHGSPKHSIRSRLANSDVYVLVFREM